MAKIREYAVRILEVLPNDTICILYVHYTILTFKFNSLVSILLQLVQSLKYDSLEMQSPLLEFLVSRAKSDLKMATNFYWNVRVPYSL